jgi:branched-chain amino acid transport system ATP-binding protein
MGDQRLTELARALSSDPDLVLLDEPFAGADAEGVERMSAAIRSLAVAGHAVVVVDHHVDLLADIADRLVLMFQGRIIFDGPPAEGLRSREMRTIYFGEVDD